MSNKLYNAIRRIYHWVRYYFYHLKYHYFLSPEWQIRINDVVSCNDNKYIPRVPEAGNIHKKFQVMHNGIKVKKNGYYGIGITKMLVKSKGVHEPQEERVFGQILKKMPTGATIIELGAYWSFYSMWFLKEVGNGKAYLFEPNKLNLVIGKENFKVNGFQGNFNHAYIGSTTNMANNPPMLTIDHIVQDKQIEFIDILHSDIEGFELDMLKGSVNTIRQHRIGYFVISTHSNTLHYACLDILKQNDFIIICTADIDNTFSVDGLIIARAANYPGIAPVEIAQKTKAPN